jgi:hypothetical protein
MIFPDTDIGGGYVIAVMDFNIYHFVTPKVDSASGGRKLS